MGKAVVGGLAAASLCVLAGCGGGGDDGGNGGSGGGDPGRGLRASVIYQLGPLTAPTGQPIFLKTLIGDLNGDGRHDVVTFTNWTINGSDVVVLYQGPSGEMESFLPFNSVTDLGLTDVRDIAIADMNGDGRSDLLVYGIAGTSPLVVLYQDALGDLSPTAYAVAVGPLVLGGRFAVGDLNGDGRNDVVISGSPMTALLQGADGNIGSGLGSAVALSASTGSASVGEVRIADMDDDGDNDVVFQAGDTMIGVLPQTAPGVFAGAPDLYSISLTFATAFLTFAVGDVSGDGKIDVVVPDPGNSGFLNILAQNTAGTLDPAVRIPITSSPLYGIEIADLDKDGLNDIHGDVVDAGAPTGIGQVHVFFQRPDHGFGASSVYAFPTSAGGGSQSRQSLSIGDVNADGWPDAVVSWLDEGIFVLLNVPRSSLGVFPASPPPAQIGRKRVPRAHQR